jgi:hypothetical protein
MRPQRGRLVRSAPPPTPPGTSRPDTRWAVSHAARRSTGWRDCR